MKQQIIVFFAIVATLQFCSTTASPVEPNKAKDDHEQGHNQQQPDSNTLPKVNMQKVQAVKELCEVLINSSNAHDAAKQKKPEAHEGAEHGKTENHVQPPHQNHEAPNEHADNAEHKQEHNGSHSESEGSHHHEQHGNEQEHHESGGANQEHHHHHHHQQTDPEHKQ